MSHRTNASQQPSSFPEPALTAQRPPESPINYGITSRVGDWWAGVRDRRVVTININKVAGSPWLQGVEAQCLTALEAERLVAHTSLAVIDAAIAAARQDLETSRSRGGELEVRRAELSRNVISNDATTAADVADDPAVRKDRKQRQQDANLGRMDAQLSEFSATADAQIRSIQTLVMARCWHWTILTTRAVRLISHYNRRVGTYTRYAFRRPRTEVYAPHIQEPDWLDSGVPSIADPINH